MHQCHYCLEYRSIQAFHHSQDDVICQDCHDEQQFEYHVQQAFILQQRKEMKKQLQELDNEELPF
jgi:hypothetical protein